MVDLLAAGIRPRQIMTKQAFENAIAVVMALGGSTNAVLHLLAIAHEARVDLELDDFNKVAARVPHLADTKPHGRFHMVDLDRIGGVPVVMRELLEAGPAPRGLPDGDRADGGREPGRPRPAGARRRRWSTRSPTPSTDDGGLAVLTGSLAPQGSVVKVAGIDQLSFAGTARVFDGEPAGHGGHPGRLDRAGDRGGHPLRGPQGRARACARCWR